MRSLSDTIARLSVYRKMSSAADVAADAHVPARLKEVTGFGSNPGNLILKTYVPANLPANSPLVVVLHGCTQTAAGYDYGSGWSQLADRFGFALLFPEQKRQNNPNLCFNWFVRDDIHRNGGETLSIRQMVEFACSSMNCDRQRIFVTGLSAGGAMTTALLAAYPELFAGGAIIAGLPYGCATTVPEAFDRMRGHGIPSPEQLQALLRSASNETGRWPKLSIWHGDADRTVVPSNANAIVDQWREAHDLNVLPERRDLGNGVTRDVYLSSDGDERIEMHLVPGMAHGTPLAPASGIGNAGPYMLNVGINSTLHIAQFWGIAPVSASEQKSYPRPEPVDRPKVLNGEIILRDPLSPGEPMAPGTASASATGVRRIIEDALRKAGFMR